jgi:PAS domain S-box-containing protein
MDNEEKAGNAHGLGDTHRLLLALLLPLAAFALQWFFWAAIQPYVWFFFYPAVFFSAWLGGLRGGLAATVLSTGVVWWFFIPSRYSFILERPASALAMGIFAGLGVLFSLTHERLRKANQRTSATLAAALAVRENLEERCRERTDELSRTVDALRESEERLRQLGDNLPESYVYQYLREADGTPCFVYLSAGVEKLHGVSRQAVLRDAGTLHRQIDPEQMPALAAAEAASLQSMSDLRMELRICRADGRWRWLKMLSRPRRKACGQIFWDGVATDITERKRAEAEISTLNDRLHHLISAIKELSSAHTLELVQRIVATSARKLAGADGATFVFREGDCCYYADEDAIGPLWKGEKFPLTSCISGWVMLHRVPAVIADIYADERIPVEAYKPTFVKSLAMIPVNTTEPFAAIGSYWRHRHAPSELEVQLLQTLADAAARAVENVHLLNELEDRVRQRTAQLEAVNRELETFSYSVSHDLKAPLRGIDGYSKLLNEDYGDRLDAEGRRFLQNIRLGAAQMHELIEDLLDYSRMERRSLQSARLDLSALVQAVLAERLPETAPAEVLVRLQAPDLSVLADRDGLAIVLRNLLENALKFSQKAQPPSIEIGARTEGDKAILWVRDNGIGFDMKFHDRIFDIFQRLERAEDYPGTGIGLALVRKAMQRMGGRVWAESAPGAGATFFLELPR